MPFIPLGIQSFKYTRPLSIFICLHIFTKLQEIYITEIGPYNLSTWWAKHIHIPHMFGTCGAIHFYVGIFLYRDVKCVLYIFFYVYAYK